MKFKLSRFTIQKSAVLAMFVLVAMFGGQVMADIVVVGHNSLSSDSLDRKTVKKLFLGKARSLPDGSMVKVYDYIDDRDVKTVFYKKVTNKSMSQLKAYWSKMIFSGKAVPPETLKSDAEIIDVVSSTPGAIGYVDMSNVSSSVKVLYKLDN